MFNIPIIIPPGAGGLLLFSITCLSCGAHKLCRPGGFSGRRENTNIPTVDYSIAVSNHMFRDEERWGKADGGEENIKLSWMLQWPPPSLSELHPDRDGGDGLLPGEVSPVWPGAAQQEQQQETLSQESGGHQGGLGPANQISSLNCQQLLDVTSLHCTTVLNKMSRFHNGIFQSFNNAPSSFDILPSPIDSTEERSGPHPSPQTSQLTGVENQPTPTSHPAQAGALFNCLWIIPWDSFTLYWVIKHHRQTSHWCLIILHVYMINDFLSSQPPAASQRYSE